MAWKRVKHPSEVVNVGDEIDVKVLKFDRERNRVSLGLKQLGEDPWADLARRYPVGTRLFGKVTNIADYGCFVEIEEGVEGLVHVSEMDWTNKNVNPAKVVHIGDEVEVMVLDIDEERRRISLGMKQCMPIPGTSSPPPTTRATRPARSSRSPISASSSAWTAASTAWCTCPTSPGTPGRGSGAQLQEGRRVEAVVLAVDPERERISLGVKQLDKDPFSNFLAEHPKGSIVKGVVRKWTPRALSSTWATASRAPACLRAVPRPRRGRPHRAEGRRGIEAKFIGVDRKTRAISLSIKAKEATRRREAV
jgi:small subunit ribosomal protein S1